MVGAAGIFSVNRNFYGFVEKVENLYFFDFVILLPWRHFGSRSRALGV